MFLAASQQMKQASLHSTCSKSPKITFSQIFLECIKIIPIFAIRKLAFRGRRCRLWPSLSQHRGESPLFIGKIEILLTKYQSL